MIAEFTNYIRTNELFQKNDQLLVAVSGGADSVALCELCHRAGYHFEMAHCNFQLRGKESDRDEQFVRELAAGLGAKLHTIRFDTVKYSKEKKVSIEVAARELRYDWFDNIITEMRKKGPAFLLTAHHRDDSIETLLMNFFKGTGIRGLQGIPLKNGYIRRPLLFAAKQQINDFLAKNNIPHVEDSTNNENEYTRNFFRNKLIPELGKVFPAVKENLQGNIERSREIGEIYSEAINKKLKKLLTKKDDEIHIPVLKLRQSKVAGTLLFEIVKDYGFSPAQLPDILHLTTSISGSYVSSPTHRIIRNRDWLIITPVRTAVSGHILIEKEANKISYPGGTIIIEKRQWSPGQSIPASANMALLNAGNIKFPLLLRRWKEGDYFYPLGMNKKKKLSRFFIDQKLSLPDKERVWVMEQDKKIIWVINHRIDDRFKILPSTTEVYLFKSEEQHRLSL